MRSVSWHSEVAANLDTLQKLVRRFNSSQSEVKVKLAYQGTDDEEMTKLVASLRGGELPNIVYLDEVHTQRLIDSGAIAPVQDFIDQENYDLSDLDKKAVDYYTLDGKLWAMPFGTVVPLLYYNKVTFREVGLDPENPPKDLEELRQASEKMLQRDSQRQRDAHRRGHRYQHAWHLDLILQEHGDLYANNENGRAGRATEVLVQRADGPGLLPVVARHGQGRPGHERGAQPHRRRHLPDHGRRSHRHVLSAARRRCAQWWTCWRAGCRERKWS